MNVHKNARLALRGRERATPQAVAEAAGVCRRTVRLQRVRAGGMRIRATLPRGAQIRLSFRILAQWAKLPKRLGGLSDGIVTARKAWGVVGGRLAHADEEDHLQRVSLSARHHSANDLSLPPVRTWSA
jgi:hypothetical protein